MQDALNELNEKIRTECPLLGKRVTITGTSRRDLNGKTGLATSFDHGRCLYVVVLDATQEGKEALQAELSELNLLPN